MTLWTCCNGHFLHIGQATATCIFGAKHVFNEFGGCETKAKGDACELNETTWGLAYCQLTAPYHNYRLSVEYVCFPN